MRRVIVPFAISLVLATSVSAADKRIAFVIGNSNYQYDRKLPNAVSDAKLVANRLSLAGFTVLPSVLDGNEIAMRRGIQQFGARAKSSDLVAFYYAGHGVQSAGRNFLVPVDAHLQFEQDLDAEAVPLSYVFDYVRPTAANALRVFMLDACRTNQFQLAPPGGGARGSMRGLAPVQRVANTLVSYATQPNDVAEDGNLGNSPYALALNDHLATAGKDIRIVFGFVRDTTLQLTDNRQRPILEQDLGGTEIHFVAAKADGPAKSLDFQEQYIVFFGFNRFDLTTQGTTTIEEAAKSAKRLGARKIEVVGYTDTVLGVAESKALSERQASTVANALVSFGVDPSIITTVGAGKRDLLVQTADGVKEPRNRRATIEIYN